VNAAYKHLDAKLRLAELTIGQWLGVLTGAGLGLVWALYVSPFGTDLTLVIALYIAGIPAGAAILAGVTELNLWLLLRSAVAWRRASGQYIGGAGDAMLGYVLSEDRDERAARHANGRVTELDLAALWEGS
jgi:hypothetical protein